MRTNSMLCKSIGFIDSATVRVDSSLKRLTKLGDLASYRLEEYSGSLYKESTIAILIIFAIGISNPRIFYLSKNNL